MKNIKHRNIYKEIHTFFKVVCDGIRAEYENGASERDFDIDKQTLDRLLIEIIEGDEK